MAIFSPDERDIILKHRKDTICFVLAETGICLGLAKDRVRSVTGRSLLLVNTDALPTNLPPSWMLAVFLCPGDNTEALAKWAAKLGPARMTRIYFYEPEEFGRLAETYAAWIREGLPDPIRRRAHGFKELNRLLGVDLNTMVLRDYS